MGSTTSNNSSWEVNGLKKKCHSLLLDLQVCFEQMCTYFCNFLASTSPPFFLIFLCKNMLYKMINTKPDDQMQCYYLFTFGILLNRALCLECKGRESPKFFKCKVSWERVSTRSDLYPCPALHVPSVQSTVVSAPGSVPRSHTLSC